MGLFADHCPSQIRGRSPTAIGEVSYIRTREWLIVRARQVVPGLIAAVIAVSLAGVASAEPAQAEVGINLQPPKEAVRGPNRTHPGEIFHEQQASFNLGTLNYAIRYMACIDPAHPTKVSPIEGYIGMPLPSSSNWYAGGFLFIRLNGRDIGATPQSSMMVVERGDRAMLDMVWRDEAANVRVRFIGLPGYDCLFCEVTLEPIEEITSVGIRFSCYPSYFTSWNKRDGARRIQTPSQLVEQGPRTEWAPLSENWWGVYYDEVFDVAKGEGAGPCSMLIVPEEGGEVSFSPGSYGVGTDTRLPGDTTRVRMAFWDHKGVANADALSLVGEQADDIREMLEQADFTPVAVREFDVAAAREQVEEALASENTREELADQIEQIQKWLATNAPGPGEENTTPSVAAQEDLLRSIDMYNSFKWQVLLTELLNNL